MCKLIILSDLLLFLNFSMGIDVDNRAHIKCLIRFWDKARPKRKTLVLQGKLQPVESDKILEELFGTEGGGGIKESSITDQSETQKPDVKVDPKICDCGLEFKNQTELEIHIWEVHENPHKCHDCGKGFAENSELESHECRYTADAKTKVSKLNCQHCEKTFMTKIGYNYHVQIVHEGKREYRCEMCGNAFSRMKTLTEHIRVIHEGRKDHCCEHCGKAFGTRKNMLDHVKMVHDKIRDKICR